MGLKILEISVNKKSIKPGLFIDVGIDYFENSEILISYEGLLKSENGMELTQIWQYPSRAYHGTQNLKTLNPNEKNKKGIIRVKLFAQLDEHIIEHIEKCRHENRNKDVCFIVDLKVKYQTTTYNLREQNQRAFNLLTLKDEDLSSSFTIPQSDWVHKFSKDLNIGNYILLEFNEANLESIHEKFTNVEESFDDLKNKLLKSKKILERMCDYLRIGDWDAVMRHSREFFELFKLGKNNPIESQLKEMYKARNGSDIGFQPFYEAICNMFNYISKFIHELDKSHNLQIKPTAKSEDAYFAYSTCISVFKIILGKI
jgi:hypothetical protein